MYRNLVFFLILSLSGSLLAKEISPQGLKTFDSAILKHVHKNVLNVFDSFELGFDEKAYKWQLESPGERGNDYQAQIENNLLSFYIDGTIVEPLKGSCLGCTVSNLFFNRGQLDKDKELEIDEVLLTISDYLSKQLQSSKKIKVFALYEHNGDFGTFSGFAIVDLNSHQAAVFAAGFSE